MHHNSRRAMKYIFSPFCYQEKEKKKKRKEKRKIISPFILIRVFIIYLIVFSNRDFKHHSQFCCLKWNFSKYWSGAFKIAEYRTVSGVAGPLVILEKVKVDWLFCHFFFLVIQSFYWSIVTPTHWYDTITLKPFRVQNIRRLSIFALEMAQHDVVKS